jgi:hypothetical protein
LSPSIHIWIIDDYNFFAVEKIFAIFSAPTSEQLELDKKNDYLFFVCIYKIKLNRYLPPLYVKKGTTNSPSTTLANVVLPVSGRPISKTPGGYLPPRRIKCCDKDKISILCCSI